MTTRLALKSWDSNLELKNHLAASQNVVIGTEAECPRKFYSFTAPTPRGPLEVGVISSGLGNPVEAIAFDTHGVILVGHDTVLSWLQTGAPTSLTTKQLWSAFYEFVAVDSEDEILVLHELGALRVNASGQTRWSVDTDIVEGSSVDPSGYLVLKVMGSRAVKVSLDSGATLP